MTEPNLQELKDAVLVAKEDTRISAAKVKLFSVTGSNTVNGRQLLEDQMNAFLNTLDSWYLQNITIDVNKNFLPMTNMGEYQEMWYGMICWSEDV